MNIKQNLLPESKYSLKSPYSMSPIGICVHNTANDASAKNEIAYMVSNTLQTSFHLAVDDIEVWQGLPLDRNGWHAGDGNGDGNRKHIGLEICYSKSGGEKFDKAEDRAVDLIVYLLKKYGWGVDRVKKHQDFSSYHKYCPHRTLDLGWDRFINKIESRMGGDMSDMYTLPSGQKVDLSNRESNIVTAKTWDEVVHQKLYIKKSEAEQNTKVEVAKETTKLTEQLRNALELTGNVGFSELLNHVKELVSQSNSEQDMDSSTELTLPEFISNNYTDNGATLTKETPHGTVTINFERKKS